MPRDYRYIDPGRDNGDEDDGTDNQLYMNHDTSESKIMFVVLIASFAKIYIWSDTKMENTKMFILTGAVFGAVLFSCSLNEST